MGIRGIHGNRKNTIKNTFEKILENIFLTLEQHRIFQKTQKGTKSTGKKYF